jgi:hypothetical protein
VLSSTLYRRYCKNAAPSFDQKHKQVTSKLWDRLDLDAADVERSADGKRQLTAPRWRRDGR